MHFQPAVVALAAFAALTTASPVPSFGPAFGQPGFSIEQIPVGKKILKNGAASVAKTYKKFNVKIPTHVQAAAAVKAVVATTTTSASSSVQSGEVVATPEEYDEAYTCPVSIGTPAQILQLDFDTGSSDLWVFSGRMPKTQREDHAYFTIRDSTTAVQDVGASWDIDYGDGSGAGGVVYYDKVVIGSVTATSQAVECATSAAAEFIESTNDGLVGLAAMSINTVVPDAVDTFIGNVLSSLESPLFTVALKHDVAGTYTFGYLNASQYSGDITYTDVSFTNGYWEFDVEGYSVGSTSYDLVTESIADTGTTLVYVPDSILADYYAQISSAVDSTTYGGWVFDCSITPPDFSINVGGASHAIPGSYINYASVSDTLCFGGLQSSADVGFSILGDIFLKSVYAVFDQGNSRIGFASQA